MGLQCSPGRQHDVTCAGADPELLPALGEWTDEHHVVLADLGYEGERDKLILPLRPGTNGTDHHGRHLPHSEDRACYNALHSATRARAEADNAWLRQTFKILRHVRISPGRIGTLAAAALVLLHLTHDRTT